MKKDSYFKKGFALGAGWLVGRLAVQVVSGTAGVCAGKALDYMYINGGQTFRSQMDDVAKRLGKAWRPPKIKKEDTLYGWDKV